MEDRKRTIRIDSILGGQSKLTHFATTDQYLRSVGIDPSLPVDSSGAFYNKPSGLVRPTTANKMNGDSLTGAPYWQVPNPKDGFTYVYDAIGSVYTHNDASIAGLGDLNDGQSASGNGAAYYDNYIYFARDTTIARYGPLNGTPTFTDDYWITTLSKTALVNTEYPEIGFVQPDVLPNHIMHRHSDGRLYFADVVDNKGTLHYIQTTKTTVEGDTDNGSTYNKIQFGYGLWPMAIESYGSDLVIALFEGKGGNSKMKAKLAFWDTTSQNFNKITWVEFPDHLITAIKNVNGVLYVFSTSTDSYDTRLVRFVGGYTFEEVAYLTTFDPPYPGAVISYGDRLLFGSFIQDDLLGDQGVIVSYGRVKGIPNEALYVVGGCSNSNNATITSLSRKQDDLLIDLPNAGFSNGGSGGTNNGIDTPRSSSGSSSGYSSFPQMWISQVYKIGQPFKFKKIRIPLAQAMASGMIVTPKIHTDDGKGTTYTLTAINNTNDPGAFNVVRRSGSAGETITGQHNFFLELKWTGETLSVINLPITIEYELLDD